HTTADTISARTLRIRPMVMTAPTMILSCSMPGSPVPLGSMSITAALLLTGRWVLGCQVHGPSRTFDIQGRMSEAGADVEEEVDPRDPGARESCGADRHPQAGAGLARGLVVAVRGGDRPHDRGDDQHEHGDDEHEHQQSADDRA